MTSTEAVAYWAGGIGWFTLDEANSPDFDLESLRRAALILDSAESTAG